MPVRALRHKTDKLAGHLMWLYSADDTEDQEHADFFTDLTGTANEGFADAFEEPPIGHGAAGSVQEEINAKARAYADENGVDFSAALAQVLGQNPNLYDEYMAERESAL